MSRFRIGMIAVPMCFGMFACSSAGGEASKPSGGGAQAAGGLSGIGGQVSAGGTPSTLPPAGAAGASGGSFAAGGGSGGAGDSAGSAGSAGASNTPLVCPPPKGSEAPLPLAVTPNFSASGYFANPEANLQGIKEGTCEGKPGLPKTCFKYTFTPTVLDTASTAFGGVFWQYGVNNWGAAPGMKVAAGATKVTFKAWGAVGGEAIVFSAGGIQDAKFPCGDTVRAEVSTTLTTTPTEYTIDVSGQQYAGGIIGGFAWTASVASTSPLSFYVEEIQWTE